MKSALLLTCILFIAIASPGYAQVVSTPNGEANAVESIDSADVIEITVPSVDGKVAWRDVARMIADSMTLDEASVERLLPKGQLNLNSPLAGIVLTGINLASQDAIQLDRVTTDDGEQALRVRCQRGLIRAAPAEMIECTCDWDPDLPARSTTKPIVILLHGYQGAATSWNELREHLRALDYGTATIQYNFDQPIAEAAKEIALATRRELAQRNVSSAKVVLIGHSMGGLVAREWTENPDLPGESIVGLITLGSPHGGSNWATMPPMSDLFTGHEFNSQDLAEILLHQSSSQGLKDLVPDSEFLKQLAARPRRSDVAYTAIVGNQSPLEEADVVVLRGTLRTLDREGSLMRLIRPRIRPLMSSFDELSNGKGDGMVACKNATILGCEDCVVLPVTHLEMVRRTPRFHDDQTHPVWEVVVERLGRISR